MKTQFDSTSLAVNLCIACCVPCYASVIFRNEVRIGYGLSGTWLGDCIVGSLCPFQSTCQLTREVTGRGSVMSEPLVVME